MHRTAGTKIALLLCCAVGGATCDADRLDSDRHCDDVRQEDTHSDSAEENTSSMHDSDTETELDTDTDYSCHYVACMTDADCTCTGSTACPQTGPDFIKHHCLILDCDPKDSSTCPEGVPCIDATDLSFGEISWVCFSM